MGQAVSSYWLTALHSGGFLLADMFVHLAGGAVHSCGRIPGQGQDIRDPSSLFWDPDLLQLRQVTTWKQQQLGSGSRNSTLTAEKEQSNF
jgi:hypothetical protein